MEKKGKRIIESCVECLLRKQRQRVSEFSEPEAQAYVNEITNLLENRREDDTSPYIGYCFNQIYRKYFGDLPAYGEVKKEYNDLVLSMEAELEAKIEASRDPLALSLMYARIGNYIDFAALTSVDRAEFLSFFENVAMSDADGKVYSSFLEECAKAKTFLLLADNCGEIVLDKLFIKQLKKRFLNLEVSVMVRGAEIVNDATVEDAEYCGMDKVAEVVSSGLPIAGTVYEMLTDEAKSKLDNADVVLAKGQGNYEALADFGRHVFYLFLCKCELFTTKFNVPKFTGMFVEQK